MSDDVDTVDCSAYFLSQAQEVELGFLFWPLKLKYPPYCLRATYSTPADNLHAHLRIIITQDTDTT